MDKLYIILQDSREGFSSGMHGSEHGNDMEWRVHGMNDSLAKCATEYLNHS